jgi:hypothetical protein
MTELRSLSAGDHEVIGRIIGESFADDPVNQFLLGPQECITAFNIHAAKKLYIKKGFGHMDSDHTGGSMWLPAGVSKHIPLWNSLEIIPPMLRHNGIRGTLKAMAGDEGLSKEKPAEPHYYLYAIGNIPSAQGKGLGGKLMEAGLAEVDKHHMPAYLESSKEQNNSFYQRFGFKVLKEFVPTPGCPPLWLMWRDAR